MCLWQDVKLRKTQLEVGHLTPGHVTFGVIGSSFFSEKCKIVGRTAMANLSALRAAVFSLSAKNRTGGGVKSNPPPVRGLLHHEYQEHSCP